jgi:hypothetical protein
MPNQWCRRAVGSGSVRLLRRSAETPRAGSGEDRFRLPATYSKDTPDVRKGPNKRE